ncbi:MAG: CapA family protein [bacterium]|nr:CapA family protein [bacterium]
MKRHFTSYLSTVAAPLFIALALLGQTQCFNPPSTAPAPPAEPQVKRITVAAVGDLLMHKPIVTSAFRGNGAYSFAPIFAPVAPYLKAADYTIANLETRLAGAERGYSGYPRFNSPASLAVSLREAGIDLLATANNHSLDMGVKGITATLDSIDKAGLAHVGTARGAAEQAKPFIADVNGIKLGVLNYTAETNGIPLPGGSEFALNILRPDRVTAEAADLRARGADIVLAVLHFGREYQRVPDEVQRKLADDLCRNGVDVIIGSHPHVVQPVEKIEVEREGRPYTCIVAYSLGNFISNQRDRYRDSGIILYLEIDKDDAGTRVTRAGYLPVWVQRSFASGSAGYRVLPAHPGSIPATDLPLSEQDKTRLNEVGQELSAHLDKPDQGIGLFMPAMK